MAGNVAVKKIFFEFTGNTDGVDKSLKNIDKSIKGLSRGFGRLGKLMGVGFGAYSIKKIADMGKQMSHLAFQTGLSVSSLSAMSSAFKSLGSSAGTFSRIAGRMNQGIIGLAMGNPEIASKLAAMGISTVDKSGRLKSSQQAMYEVADWAKGMKGRGIDSRMILAALQEMGFDAASAQQAIYGGSGAFKAEAGKARAQGRYLTGYEAQQLKALSNNLAIVSDQFEYLGAAVLAPFAEAAEPLFRGLQEGIADTIKTIRKNTILRGGHTLSILDKETGWAFDWTQFGENLKLIADGIVLTLKEGIKGLIEMMKETGGFLGWIAGKISNIPDSVNMDRAGFRKNEDGSWSDVTGKIRAGSLEEARALSQQYSPTYAKGPNSVKLETDEPLPVSGVMEVHFIDENGNERIAQGEISNAQQSSTGGNIKR